MARRRMGKGWNVCIARLNHMTKSLLSDRLFHLSANKFPTGLEKQTVHYWYFIAPKLAMIVAANFATNDINLGMDATRNFDWITTEGRLSLMNISLESHN